MGCTCCGEWYSAVQLMHLHDIVHLRCHPAETFPTIRHLVRGFTGSDSSVSGRISLGINAGKRAAELPTRDRFPLPKVKPDLTSRLHGPRPVRYSLFGNCAGRRATRHDMSARLHDAGKRPTTAQEPQSRKTLAFLSILASGLGNSNGVLRAFRAERRRHGLFLRAL